MRIRLLIPMCALLVAAACAACSSAGKCRRGDRGCACKPGNVCLAGASCSAGQCKRSTGAAGGGGAGRGAGGRGTAGSGAAGSDAGTTVTQCSTGSFEDACRSYCVALCESQASFCRASRCATGFCDMTATGAFHATCVAACGSDANPAGCMHDVCVEQTRTRCENFSFGDADAGTLTSACFEDDPLCVLTGS
jgi:hypothetical protein